MEIRLEEKEDRQSVYALIEEAFKTAEVSDGTEQEFYSFLKESNRFIPSLSFVAVAEEKIIGHVMATKMKWKNKEQDQGGLLLAPLSVALPLRKTGVGSKLVQALLLAAKNMDYTFVLLVGNPGYYKRFGFVAAKEYHILYPGIPDEYVLLYPLWQDRTISPGDVDTSYYHVPNERA